MLKNIRLHISDSEEQDSLEKEAAKFITANHRKNINAFQRFVPSLTPIISKFESQRLSVFCNKNGELNIVDYGLGRTFYGLNPDREIESQVQSIMANCPFVDLSESASKENNVPNWSDILTLEEVPAFRYRPSSKSEDCHDCLVILGCGLAKHIELLVENYHYNHIIVYEPDIEYFKCSALAGPWQKIFQTAQAKSINLYLQIGKDSRDLIDDVKELKTVVNVKGFSVYKHYNHPIFDSIIENILFRDFCHLQEKGISFDMNRDHMEYVPPWTPPVDLLKCISACKEDPLFKKNLKAFSIFFPDIYEQFKDFVPKVWIPVKSPDGEVNIIKKSSLAAVYSDSPEQDCLAHYESFYKQPNRDGLIFGYNGVKLKHYIHYQYVQETERHLEQVEEEVGALPERLRSIIIFGLGVGYQLNHLYDNHTVEKIFICEPNPDFFFASLFAIEWHQLLRNIGRSDGRIYLNIGDEGTSLFRDLLGQFYSVGPHILNDTYFYQGYYNSSLTSAISQLREQLKIIISMGEFFDHAYYGISQTLTSLQRETPYLKNAPAKQIDYIGKQTPVFLVGNGPSLDGSIEYVKELQSQAIIVSCGTTLQPFHRHGIIPDFHAEIEQNRATFDWSSLIDDREYLKQISLLSCNGIHPHTQDLFKECFLVFKEGESSTVSALDLLGEDQFHTLEYAFPTVANFTTNLFMSLGFQEIYLIGVDLGFVDKRRHHSLSSGYYDDKQKERYDYEKFNNTSLVVPGNFRSMVNTKHEFKVAKEILEQMIAQLGRNINIYNCSDGARIAGTHSLILDNILITSTAEEKQNTLHQFKQKCFIRSDAGQYQQDFEHRFQQPELLKDIEAYEQVIHRTATTLDDAEDIIKSQRDILNASYLAGKSSFFFYFFGTINYANAVKSKILNSISVEEKAVQTFNKALKTWQHYFARMKGLVARNPNLYDSSTYNPIIREELLINEASKDKRFLIVSNSPAFGKAMDWVIEWFKFEVVCQVIHPDDISKVASSLYDAVIYQCNPNQEGAAALNHWIQTGECPVKGAVSTIVIDYPNKTKDYPFEKGICFLPFYIDPDDLLSTKWCCNLVYHANIAFKVALTNYDCQLILPKYVINENTDAESDIFPVTNIKSDSNTFAYLFTDHIAIFSTPNMESTHPQNITNACGTIGKYLHFSEDLITPPLVRLSAEKMEEIRTNMVNANELLQTEQYDYARGLDTAKDD